LVYFPPFGILNKKIWQPWHALFAFRFCSVYIQNVTWLFFLTVFVQSTNCDTCAFCFRFCLVYKTCHMCFWIVFAQFTKWDPCAFCFLEGQSVRGTVARWICILEPKIPIWVNFGSCHSFRIFYCCLVYFKAVWYILRQFGIF
jgi:hypothetical protein